MKKSLLIAALSLIFCHPALAYPGWTGKQVKNWAEKHSFVSPYVRELHAGVTLQFVAARDIDGGKELWINYYDGYGGTSGPGMLSKQLENIEIFIYTKNDFRKKVEGIWLRDSEKAKMLLTNIYNADIAEDFKNSKLVFKGVDYSFEGNFPERRDKIWHIPTQSGEMWEAGKPYFFKGAKYFYEVNEKSDTIIIRPLSRLNSEIAIIQYNQKAYAEYKQKEDRKKPVNLNL